MFNIFSMFQFFSKYQVLHSLPGRLRLHVPILKTIPKDWHIEEELFTDFFKLIPGIQSVSISYISANVLLTYNAAVIEEKELLAHIQHLMNIILQHSDKLQVDSPDQMEKVLKDLLPVISNEINKP